MNCNVPTDICFSFEGFCARGGKTDEHRDGWGIAFFEGLGCGTFMYPFAAAHLIDEDVSVDFQALTSPSNRVAIIATTPLTDNEVWIPINSGKLLFFQEG
jgi:predicted glutamine amidotransferase